MSQQEFEQNDLEVMGIVNKHSHPEAAAAAEEIAEAVTEPADLPVEDVPDLDAQYRERCRQGEIRYRKNKRKAAMAMVMFVAVCLCLAASLLVAFYIPKVLIWVVNVGVLASGIAIALKIEQYIRWWR